MSKLGQKVVRWFYDGNKTKCVIQNQGAELPIVVGEVKKYAKDLPNKRLARTESFRRAMSTAVVENSIPKVERKAIWDDFRSQINQPTLV